MTHLKVFASTQDTLVYAGRPSEALRTCKLTQVLITLRVVLVLLAAFVRLEVCSFVVFEEPLYSENFHCAYAIVLC